MLPKNQRITRSEFKSHDSTRVRPYHHALFTVRIVRIDNMVCASAKVACIVSKKIAPSSVDRHLLRRRVYHCFQAFMKEISQNTLYFVTLKPDVRKASYQDLYKAISDCISSHK